MQFAGVADRQYWPVTGSKD